jgi:DNA-binding LacI/PurR family transcriptional regulator
MKRYSIYDVAKKAGVGIATVSRVINNSKHVKNSTRAKVQEVIKELDYKPDFFARNLVKKTSRTIGLLIPDIINPVFPEIAKGVSDKAFLSGYTVFLGNTDESIEKEIKLVNQLIDKKVDGIIFISTEMCNKGGDYSHYTDLMKKNIPTVLINGSIKGTDIPFVRINEQKSGYIATKHMIKKGLRKISFLGGPENSIPTTDKLKGYKKAFREFNLTIEKKYIILDKHEIKNGFKNTTSLLNMEEKPEGIITVSDALAIEAIKAARAKNISIPDNLKIIGFDDIKFSSSFSPSITTIAQPKYKMGTLALDMLIHLTEKKVLPERGVVIEPKLILRESCP